MKKISFTLLLGFCFIGLLSAQENNKKGYSVSVKVDGLSDTMVYLAYYYGKGQFYRDTAKFDESGLAVFEKDDSLEHGMYTVLLKQTKLFDFMADSQEMSFETDTSDYLRNIKVKGSEESKLFFDYLHYLNKQQLKAKRLQDELKSAKPKKAAELKEELAELDTEVKEYIAQLHEDHKGTLTSNFVKGLAYPEVPEAPKNEDGSIDSTFEFRYFKNHFFDNIDFSDGRLVRTSIFHEKITYYLDKLTYQNVDSIIESVDLILTKAEQSPDLFRYALSYMTSKYERSDKMGMDAVFVHLGKNYFMKGKAKPWFSDKQLEKLEERVKALDPLLIGKKAPNIVVKDTAMEKFIQLYDVEANYTIVYIWSPECGHCKKATPKLKKIYDNYKDKGVEVFAVGNEFENEEWIRFIQKHKLDWINGSDGEDFTSNFRSLYDVYSTPQTYLLDKDKKIIAKKVSVEALEEILNYYLEKDKKDKNEE